LQFDWEVVAACRPAPLLPFALRDLGTPPGSFQEDYTGDWYACKATGEGEDDEPGSVATGPQDAEVSGRVEPLGGLAKRALGAGT
jgi:hypothetical protein